MEIKTKTDWILLAEITVPKLPSYAAEFGIVAHAGAFRSFLDARDYDGLHRLFESLWSALPNVPDIRKQPFFDLCDLCSEFWVFENDAPETVH